MPDFSALKDIKRVNVRSSLLQRRLVDAADRKKAHSYAFLRKKFPGANIYGYMIAGTSRLDYNNKAGWKLVSFLLRSDMKPVDTYAGYDVFKTSVLSAEPRKMFIGMLGDSGYVSDTVLVFVRRGI